MADEGEIQEKAAGAVASAFAALDQVVAVVLGGSRATGWADERSDIDLYVYASRDVPVAFRRDLASRRGTAVEVDNRFWEPGDEWTDIEAGVHIDVMFRHPIWAETELAAVLDRHEARLGYTTCFWHNIRRSRILFDRDGWYAALQTRAAAPYPEGLMEAIVAKNRPVLRDIAGSFRAQAIRAAERGDRVSVNHRTAAFVASYFDVLFALNRTPHPGEKRLARIAGTLPHRPAGFEIHLAALFAAAGTADLGALQAALDGLCDGLDAILSSSRP